MICRICGTEMVKHYPSDGYAYNSNAGEVITLQLKQHWLCLSCQWLDIE